MSDPPQGPAAQEGRIQDVDRTYAVLSPVWVSECQAVRETQDTAQGVRKHSLRPGTAGAGLGSLGLQGGWGHLVLRLSEIQALLDAAEELRTEWEPEGWIWPGAGRKTGESAGWILQG